MTPFNLSTRFRSLDSRDFTVGTCSPSSRTSTRSLSSIHLYKVCRGTPSSRESRATLSQDLKRSTAIRRNSSGCRLTRSFVICENLPFPTKCNARQFVPIGGSLPPPRALGARVRDPWPGNIRELQNVVERSVIVCETDNFSVDESWLSRQPLSTEPKGTLKLSHTLAAREKETIEAALRESRGQMSGPSGAGAKLGVHSSALHSKITW